MENTVVAVYDNLSEAQDARSELLASGFSNSDIRLSSEADTSMGQTDAERHHESHGGIGHFFRSLFGMEDDSVNSPYHGMYSEAVRRGSYVLAVDTADDTLHERAVDIMNRYNPVDIDERASQWSSQGWTGYDASAPRLSDDEIRADRSRYMRADTDTAASPLSASTQTTESARIPVVEEELKVGKRAVQRGGVRVWQRMKETPVHESVNLREEHVKVERHPVDKPATEADLAAFKEGTVELRESAEEAVVNKTARVVEEVVVGKEVTERREDINDTVRRTDVEVEQLGAGTAARTSGMAAATDFDDDSAYRQHWQSTYGTMGGRYEDYDSAYRYGSTLGDTDRYRTARWEDVEPDLRTRWESQHPGSAWDKVKDAVRYGIGRMSGHAHTHTGMGGMAGTGMGAATTGGMAAASTLDDDSAYRQHWQNAYGTTGGRYEDYDAAYRYGSSLGGTERYRNYRWEEVEPDLRTNWESQHPGSAWDKVKDAVRYGIDRVSGHSYRH